MNVISRCIQDIIKYWNECRWIVGLVVMGICIWTVGSEVYRRKKDVEIVSLLTGCYKLLLRICNGVYFAYAFYITFGMRYVGERREVQWIPFDGVWERPWEYPLLVENVLLFIPFGILIPHTYVRMRSGKRVLMGALATSVMIEVAQYVFRCGKTEVDDVILNCLGAIVGYGLFVIGSKGKKLMNR